jgi:hypothetical protein
VVLRPTRTGSSWIKGVCRYRRRYCTYWASCHVVQSHVHQSNSSRTSQWLASSCVLSTTATPAARQALLSTPTCFSTCPRQNAVMMDADEHQTAATTPSGDVRSLQWYRRAVAATSYLQVGPRTTEQDGGTDMYPVRTAALRHSLWLLL